MAVTHAPLIQGPRVALVLSEGEFDTTIAELGIEKDDPNGPRWSSLGNNWGLVWPLEMEDGPVWLVGLGAAVPLGSIPSTLVHESVHVWQGYREYIGEDRPSKEFEAYSVEGIFSELMRQFSESRVGRKRVKAG